MIESAFIFLGIIVMLVIIFVKIWNIMHVGRFYDKKWILYSMGIATVCWLLIFLSFIAVIPAEKTATITDSASDITTVVQTNNDYLTFSIYQDVANFMLSLNFMFSVIELVAALSTIAITPKFSRKK